MNKTNSKWGNYDKELVNRVDGELCDWDAPSKLASFNLDDNILKTVRIVTIKLEEQLESLVNSEMIKPEYHGVIVGMINNYR